MKENISQGFIAKKHTHKNQNIKIILKLWAMETGVQNNLISGQLSVYIYLKIKNNFFFILISHLWNCCKQLKV